MTTPAPPAATAVPELQAPGDSLVDFCLWEYDPPASPEGKWRGVNLFLDSCRGDAAAPQLEAIMRALRAGLGDSRTVWGVKQAQGRLNWELYFYDYERTSRSRGANRVMPLLQPWLPCDVRLDEGLPYFMFSIDLDGETLARGGRLDEIQMYIGNPGSLVSSGICYAVGAGTTLLKNFYFFFDARAQRADIEGKLLSSAYLREAGFDIDQVLWPELRDCQTIVIANKRTHDGVYFSRINVDQLLHFMRRLAFPAAQVDYLARHRDRFDHLLFDVGYDFRQQDGRIVILKSAYYGVF
jgi:hypothetical protein